MPKYLTVATYNADGVRGLIKDGGTGRRAAVEKAIKAMGGTLESFYFAFGDNDVYVTSEAPSNVSVAALSLAVGATGAVSASTIVLITPEEMDEAVKMSIAYRGPGEKGKKGKK